MCSFMRCKASYLCTEFLLSYFYVWLRSYAQGCKSASGYGESVHKTSHEHSRFSGCSERLFGFLEVFLRGFLWVFCLFVFILLVFCWRREGCLFYIEKCGDIGGGGSN